MTKPVPTAEELSTFLDVWDQTIGCSDCQKAWWAENYTDDPTLFHTTECPLYGRRDVAAYVFNLEYIEGELGHRVGIEVTS